MGANLIVFSKLYCFLYLWAMRFLLFTICVVCFYYSQVAWAQEAASVFTQTCFTEDFSDASKGWEQNSTLDKLYLIQHGRYVVHRKSEQPDLIPLPVKEDAHAFEFAVNLAFDVHTNKLQSAGLVCMVTEKGYYVLEINEKKQYRFWLKTGEEQLLLHEGDKYGWQKTTSLLPGTQTNEILLRVQKGRFDLVFNGIPTATIEDTTMQTGRIGLYVGDNARVIFDDVSIRCKEKQPDTVPYKTIEAMQKQPLTPLQKVEELEKEVERLRLELQKCRQQKP
jgi:hypothetical protein